MSFEFTPYVFAQGGGALVSLLAAGAASRRRRAPGGAVFFLMMLAIATWTVAVCLEEGAVGAHSKILLSKISYLGAVNVAPLFLLYAWGFRHGHNKVRGRAGLLWIIPAAVLGLALTNEMHGLVWSSVTITELQHDNLAVYGHGPAWWILSCYDFALVMAATISIGRAVFGAPRVFARQSAVLLAAVLSVWAGFVLYVVPGNPFPGLDLPALSFAVAGLFILWGLTRGGILALSPIARDMLIEAMPDGMIVEDARGQVVDANPIALSLLRKDSSVVGSSLSEALGEWPELAAAVSRVGPGGAEIVRRDDQYFELRVAALRGTRGGQIGTMVSLRNITNRQQAEENQRLLLSAAQRQAKELELLDQVRTSMARELELPVVFQTVVEGIARAFGYGQVSIYLLQDGRLVLQYQVGYSRVIYQIQVSQGIVGRTFRTGTPVLLKDARADPEFIGAIDGVVSEVCVPFLDQARPVGVLNVESTKGVVMGEEDLRLLTIVGEHMGIAFSRARLYAEARSNEERYRALVATLGEGVAIVDLREQFVFANPAAEAVFGVPPGGLVGRNLADFLNTSGLARVQAETQRRLLDQSSTYEMTIRRPDGEIRQIQLIASPQHDRDREVTGTLGIFRDVTELRRLQQSLELERALLLSLIDNLPDYIYLKDRDSRFILANKAQALLVGANDPRELIGKTDHDFVRKELADRYRAADRAVMESRKPAVNIEEPSEAASGDVRKVLTTKVPIFDAGGEVTGVVGISRDVTDITRAEEEREKLQDLLQQAQKMEAVGRLAGGIAHDFNNILTVITGYCEMALEEARGNMPLEANVEEIKRAARRASALTSQLLTFSRRQILQPRVFDLAELVEGMDGMLRRLLGENIRLRTFRTGRGLRVHADPGRIEQVIMNLVVNARDAMPGGGVLTVHTGTGRLAPEDISSHPEVVPGDYVFLSVSDTGQGMDEATMDRLFEPFFTTKDVGKGTGLGLATVYGIVRQSSGHITCSSKVRKGTTFTVYLPRATQEESQREGFEPRPAESGKGTESILVVEDDDSVRRYVRTILETAGYTAYSAESGLSALEMLGSLPAAPDLLLTDMVMPGMDGRVLADAVTRLCPGVRILLMSGYAEVAAGAGGQQDSELSMIRKPFSSVELLARIRETMERPVSR